MDNTYTDPTTTTRPTSNERVLAITDVSSKEEDCGFHSKMLVVCAAGSLDTLWVQGRSPQYQVTSINFFVCDSSGLNTKDVSKVPGAKDASEILGSSVGDGSEAYPWALLVGTNHTLQKMGLAIMKGKKHTMDACFMMVRFLDVHVQPPHMTSAALAPYVRL